MQELRQDELMEIQGGSDFWDALIGTIEIGAAPFVGVATSVAVVTVAAAASITVAPVAVVGAGVIAGGMALVDGIDHLKDATNGGN